MKSFLGKIVISILNMEARLIIRKYKPFVIAVTGSVGKTSTKDAIYSVLAPHFFVRKSDKSFNSEIGVPLTILGCPNAWTNVIKWFENIADGIDQIIFKTKYPDILIMEIGADHPGDIKKVAKWLKPNIAILTKVGAVPVHVEFFKSRQEVFNEKKSLIDGIQKGGTAILYGDDPEIRAIKPAHVDTIMTFGMEENVKNDVQAINYQVVYDEKGSLWGIKFGLGWKGQIARIQLKGVIGRQHVHPIIAAVAVGIAKGLTLEKIAPATEAHVPPRGRMNIISGINSSTLIDDTYNSSPDAVAEALTSLTSVKGRRVAVLGDMMELGKFAIDAHINVGTLAAASCDLLVTVGVRAQKIKEGALKAGMLEKNILSFDTSNNAAKELPNHIKAGDVVLIKGSQSPRLERVTKALLLEPDKAAELLVRQDPEWLARP
ncbi:MAG: Mur ligase family protein [Patescibacteria group bacterium]